MFLFKVFFLVTASAIMVVSGQQGGGGGGGDGLDHLRYVKTLKCKIVFNRLRELASLARGSQESIFSPPLTE